MTVAYLVNQYPHTSHSFIRREIAAVEAAGLPIARFSIRRSMGELVDPADLAEVQRTRFVLSARPAALLLAAARRALTRPLRFLSALTTACAMGWRSDRGLARHLAYLAEACILCDWLAEAKIQHIHAHFGTNAATVAMLCGLLEDVSFSFTVHGPEEFDRPQMLGLTRKIERASFVVAISDFGRAQLMRWCEPAHWPKIHVVRCGVDEGFLQAEPVPAPPEPRLVCVGRLCEQKGQLLLVEAVAALRREGIAAKVVLVGDGPMRGHIESLARHLGMEHLIHLAGWQSGQRVREEIVGSRALVLPSFAEGLPVVIMEALALGRPVISTYVAGIPELVKPGVNGWLVPAGSVSDLAAAMREALLAPVERLSEMGQAGARIVARRHNANTEARKLATLFGEAVARRSSTEATAMAVRNTGVPPVGADTGKMPVLQSGRAVGTVIHPSADR